MRLPEESPAKPLWPSACPFHSIPIDFHQRPGGFLFWPTEILNIPEMYLNDKDKPATERSRFVEG